MISENQHEAIIKAVNTAGIHACITRPFVAADLLAQAGNCYEHFKQALKQHKFKRIIKYQNIQMYQIAQNLKRKDETYKSLIKKKKVAILHLQSAKTAIVNENNLAGNITLTVFLKYRQTQKNPEAFVNAFLSVHASIKTLIMDLMLNHSIKTSLPDISAIIHGEPEIFPFPDLLTKILCFSMSAALYLDPLIPPEWPQDFEKNSNSLENFFQ